MLFIKNLKPNFNIQTDSIRANLFFLITIVLFLRYSFLSPIVILVNIECNFQIFFLILIMTFSQTLTELKTSKVKV